MPPEMDLSLIREVHFYGAGCQEDKVEVMRQILKSIFIRAEKICAEVDLLAAARGLLGRKAGFAAILGTGTNTCIYDGKEITQNIDSLGFILGDEGSGASIGKKVLSDFLRGKMPPQVHEVFLDTYGLSLGEAIHKVYREPMANRFCAGFARFLAREEVDRNYAYRIIKNAFGDFFYNLVSCYPDYTRYTFNCIGSIGYYYKDILEEVCAAYHMQTGRISSSLIRDLAGYHSSPSL
jgi:N-acetylglucosamine kinase-like BadF-type ATPase